MRPERPEPRLLTSVWRLPLALGLAFALSLPALTTGLFGDDYFLLARLRLGPHTLRRSLELYSLASATTASECIAHGGCPWFLDPTLRLELLRPLSSLLFALDDRLPGPLLAHLHSIAWFLLLVVAVYLLFRRALPGAVGGLALLLFAVDQTHFLPIGWLANRHALVAAAPVLFGLVAHVRFREERFFAGLPLSLAGYSIGLLGGETALQAMAYLFAYELTLAPKEKRVRALLPASLLLLAYLIAYRAFGYGAYHHDQYPDPFGAPAQFIAALCTRLPALIANLLGGLPSELHGFFPALQPIIVILGLASLGVVAALLRLAWPFLPTHERRGVRFLGLGALLSLLPAAAGPIGSRLLLLPSIGGAAVVAVILLHARANAGPRSLATRAALVWLAAVHLVISPLLLPASLSLLASKARQLEALVASAQISPSSRKPDVLILAVPDLFSILYPPVMATLASKVPERNWWTLSVAPFDHLLARTGPRSFTLTLQGGAFHQSYAESFFRSARAPLHAGDRVALDGLSIELLSASAISVVADRPLEDPSLRILTFSDGALRPVSMPAVGGSVLLRTASWSQR